MRVLASRSARRLAALHENFPSYFKHDTMKTAGAGPGVVRQRLLKALDLLNGKLQEAGAHMTLWMIGGGAMMLHLNVRESTADLDVVPRKGDFRALIRFAEEVAQEMSAAGEPIPADWINGDFAQQLMHYKVSPRDFERDPRYRWTNLEIHFAKAELLLALKCFSLRSEGSDLSDIRALMNRVPVQDLDHFYDIIEHYGDIDLLGDGEEGADVLLESLFKQVRAERGR